MNLDLAELFLNFKLDTVTAFVIITLIKILVHDTESFSIAKLVLQKVYNRTLIKDNINNILC